MAIEHLGLHQTGRLIRKGNTRPGLPSPYGVGDEARASHSKIGRLRCFKDKTSKTPRCCRPAGIEHRETASRPTAFPYVEWPSPARLPDTQESTPNSDLDKFDATMAPDQIKFYTRSSKGLTKPPKKNSKGRPDARHRIAPANRLHSDPCARRHRCVPDKGRAGRRR